MAEYLTNTTDLTKVAAAIREKGGTSDPLVYPDGFVTAIGNIQTGGITKIPNASDYVAFYDYEGSLLESWTHEELMTKTELPTYPVHQGLTCQGWNWTLEDLKATTLPVDVGALYITDDGKTRIYIHLEEGRTSPMLGVCPNGTVTVDWGDGTTPDTLTGTSTSTVKWTSNHAYAEPGDYVIKLTVDGTMSINGVDATNAGSNLLRFSSEADARNQVYQNAIERIEIGSNINLWNNNGFMNCRALKSITIPSGTIISNMFSNCMSLVAIVAGREPGRF